MSDWHDYDGHGGHTPNCRACEIEHLRAALLSACETREGLVQVKYRGRWMLARNVAAAPPAVSEDEGRR
jgi:hypothetical protein